MLKKLKNIKDKVTSKINFKKVPSLAISFVAGAIVATSIMMTFIVALSDEVVSYA